MKKQDIEYKDTEVDFTVQLKDINTGIGITNGPKPFTLKDAVNIALAQGELIKDRPPVVEMSMRVSLTFLLKTNPAKVPLEVEDINYILAVVSESTKGFISMPFLVEMRRQCEKK